MKNLFELILGDSPTEVEERALCAIIFGVVDRDREGSAMKNLFESILGDSPTEVEERALCAIIFEEFVKQVGLEES